MSVPSSVEELLQLIRKSGMVDEQKLTNYLHRRQAGRGLPEDSREAADAMVQDGLITGFQAEQYLLGKWRGFTIGKYKLLERVGVGGMGQVFLCEHTFMKRRVAIKVLPPAKAEQPAALGRFYREARAAGSIEHPNIVRTHDIDQDGNLHFIVMEYVDGSNLLDITKKFGPLDIHRATSYIKQVADGLEFAFRNGIIHRDIKPGNILIDRHGRAKLLDMGLARFYNDHSDNLTVKYDDKIVLGTADYVAPEQVANSHSVDIRADIYALGASFYFILAGHPPFPSGTVSQKLLWHRTKDPTPIRQVRPEVPEEIAAIIAKMMQKDPNLRYQTPAEVAELLAEWVPEHVALPAVEEMPQLSPAANEGAEEQVEQPQPVAAAAAAVTAPVAAAAAPIKMSNAAMKVSGTIKAAQTSGTVTDGRVRTSPFGASPFAPASTPDVTPNPPAFPANRSASPPPPALASGTMPAGKQRPYVSNPFSSTQADVATARAALDPTPTPEHGRKAVTRADISVPVPGRFPVITSQGTTNNPLTKKYIFFGLIGLSAFLACALIFWKLGTNSKPSTPPAQTAPAGTE